MNINEFGFVRVAAASPKLKVADCDYNVSQIKNVIEDTDNRCEYCYKVRLEETAKYAKENGFDAFSTSLLISPYQNHLRIKEIGEELEEKYGIKFLYRDFRERFREGQGKARKKQIYMQKYCGCIFSEEERYVGVK